MITEIWNISPIKKYNVAYFKVEEILYYFTETYFQTNCVSNIMQYIYIDMPSNRKYNTENIH